MDFVRCEPRHGSCALPDGHKGRHDAWAHSDGSPHSIHGRDGCAGCDGCRWHDKSLRYSIEHAGSGRPVDSTRERCPGCGAVTAAGEINCSTKACRVATSRFLRGAYTQPDQLRFEAELHYKREDPYDHAFGRALRLEANRWVGELWTGDPYCRPDIVAARNVKGALVCIDDDCVLSGGRAHVGPCEPCSCPLRHAIEECPEA